MVGNFVIDKQQRNILFGQVVNLMSENDKDFFQKIRESQEERDKLSKTVEALLETKVDLEFQLIRNKKLEVYLK